MEGCSEKYVPGTQICLKYQGEWTIIKYFENYLKDKSIKSQAKIYIVVLSFRRKIMCSAYIKQFKVLNSMHKILFLVMQQIIQLNSCMHLPITYPGHGCRYNKIIS